MNFLISLIIFVALALRGEATLKIEQFPNTVGYSVAEVSGFQKIAAYNQSVLYQLNLTQSHYDTPIMLLNLYGKTHYEMGYTYGKLLAKHIDGMYNVFLKSMLKSSGIKLDVEEWMIADAADWQWNYLAQQCPQEYLDEIAGIGVGGREAGYENLDRIVARVVVLANLPGDAKDFVYVLIREWQKSLGVSPTPAPPIHHDNDNNTPDHYGLMCSMFGVWGNRTVDGSILTGRNLDWAKDTGIANHKLITVYHEPNGYPYATFGYAGLIGSLTGISSQGLTVHEANLESNEDTFFGFPWILRLRYIMAHASNLAEATALFHATNNTVGFNFGIGSASDNAFRVFETMAQYSAMFEANDPREADAMYLYPKTGQKVHIGAPMPLALWRTNNGYDPRVRAHDPNSEAPSSWTVTRYFFIADALREYQAVNKLIGVPEALNMTAIAGDKGRQSPFHCEAPQMRQGSNILSLTYVPQVSQGQAWAAWENGHDNSWTPAACSCYVKLDMAQWWK